MYSIILFVPRAFYSVYKRMLFSNIPLNITRCTLLYYLLLIDASICPFIHFLFPSFSFSPLYDESFQRESNSLRTRITVAQNCHPPSFLCVFAFLFFVFTTHSFQLDLLYLAFPFNRGNSPHFLPQFIHFSYAGSTQMQSL